MFVVFRWENQNGGVRISESKEKVPHRRPPITKHVQQTMYRKLRAPFCRATRLVHGDSVWITFSISFSGAETHVRTL